MARNLNLSRAWLPDHAWLCLLLLFCGLIACLVNPLREMAMDDDWAYALTVRHLLESGEYRLNDWASANMVVQAYWGALSAKILGYSFAALRISTVLLLILSLIAFHALLREWGLADPEAALLTLALLSSPLVIRFAFTFMTDVPFLAWMIMALWLYSRAFRDHSYLTMALASVAAAAAIGTRQFGIAILAGLLGAWLVDRERWANLTLYAAGIILPTLTALWQFWVGFSRPTFYMTINLTAQSLYLSDFPGLMLEIFWRPMVVLQYLCIFLLPLMPFLIWRTRHASKAIVHASPGSHRFGFSSSRLWLIGWIIYFCAGLLCGYLHHRALMPSLPWNLDILRRGYIVTIPLTLVTAICGVVLGWTLSVGCVRRDFWRDLGPTKPFFALTALFLMGFHLVYVQFGDEYLIGFLPFAILAFAHLFRNGSPWSKALAGGLCLLMLVTSALWTRGILEREEALWQGAETLRSRGVQPKEISASWTWSAYHSAFQDWMAEVRGQKLVDTSNFFCAWLPRRWSNATYLVVDSPNPPAGETWEILEKVPYRGFDLAKRYLYLVRRET